MRKDNTGSAVKRRNTNTEHPITLRSIGRYLFDGLIVSYIRSVNRNMATFTRKTIPKTLISTPVPFSARVW